MFQCGVCATHDSLGYSPGIADVESAAELFKFHRYSAHAEDDCTTDRQAATCAAGEESDDAMTWLPPPSSFGFTPSRFIDWRPGQDDAVRAILESPTRITALVIPTGGGKTLTGITPTRLMSWRAVYLTSTKALQDQMERDFPGMVTLLKGQSAYPCQALAPGGEFSDYNPERLRLGCHEGPCHVGLPCSLSGASGTPATCDYYAAIGRGRRSSLLVTNYAAWLAHRLHGKGLGNPDCLILDEGHAAPDELASALRVELPLRDLRAIAEPGWPKASNTGMNHVSYWKDALLPWASSVVTSIGTDLEHAAPANASEVKRQRTRQRLSTSLKRLLNSDPDITLLREERERLTVEPVWAATYADLLWKDIPRVIVMSATVRPKTLELLGVNASDVTWFESDGDFPVARRPIYICPAYCTGPIRVGHGMNDTDETWWLNHIDKILASRPDVKGIIHTTSYARRSLLLQRSKQSSRFVTHDRENTASQVAAFKRMSGNQVFVSPSITTGYDFPDDECRFQIIAKVPFPDRRDPITERRTLLDADYPYYAAMQELVQATGRAVRSNVDFAETFIVDEHAKWFTRKYRAFAPRWFLNALSYRGDGQIPAPLSFPEASRLSEHAQ